MVQNSKLPVWDTKRIISVMSNEWQSIKQLIFKLKIKNMKDARYLQLKLTELERKGLILVEVKNGRKYWKLPTYQKGDQSEAEILSKMELIESKYEKQWKNIISRGESQRIEFKSSLKYDITLKKANTKLQEQIMKTIAGFLNSKGGILFIGVNDNGGLLGLENDYKLLGRKNNFDGLLIHLNNLLKKYFKGNIFTNLDFVSLNIESKEICIIDVEKSSIPLFLQPEGDFYIRSGTSTNKLNTEDAILYIKNHFKSW